MPNVIFVTGLAEWKKQLEIKTSSDNWTPLGYYAASSGNFLPTFRGNLSLPTSGVRNSRWDTICPETSVRNYHYWPLNNPEECSSYLFRDRRLKSRKTYVKRTDYVTGIFQTNGNNTCAALSSLSPILLICGANMAIRVTDCAQA